MYINNITEIEDLGFNDDGTMHACFTINTYSNDDITIKNAKVNFPRFKPKNNFLSVPLSPDSMMTLQLEIDPLIGVE